MISRRDLFRRALGLPLVAGLAAVVSVRRRRPETYEVSMDLLRDRGLIALRPVRADGYHLIAYAPRSANFTMTCGSTAPMTCAVTWAES